MADIRTSLAPAPAPADAVVPALTPPAPKRPVSPDLPSRPRKRARRCPNTQCDDPVYERFDHGKICNTCGYVVFCPDCGRPITEIGEDYCDTCLDNLGHY